MKTRKTEFRDAVNDAKQNRTRDEVQAILGEVNAVLGRLLEEDFDLEQKEALERVRQSLPTDEHTAKILDVVWPPAFSRTFEYVPEQNRQSAYWRCAKEKRDPEELSPAELRSRIAFGEAAQDALGTRGTTVDEDGQRIPRSAARVAAALEGENFSEPGDPMTKSERRRGERLFEKLRSEVTDDA
jgi:hypothetical protein